MDEVTQLLSFLVSFCFGFFFHILTNFHFKITDTYSLLMRYVTTLLFVVNLVLMYVLCLYYLNDGIIHIYFLIFVFLGFLGYGFLHKNVNLRKVLPSKIAKYIYKWYNFGWKIGWHVWKRKHLLKREKDFLFWQLSFLELFLFRWHLFLKIGWQLFLINSKLHH